MRDDMPRQYPMHCMQVIDQNILKFLRENDAVRDAIDNTALHRRRTGTDVFFSHIHMHAALDYFGARRVSFHRDAYDQFRQADDSNTQLIIDHFK